VHLARPPESAQQCRTQVGTIDGVNGLRLTMRTRPSSVVQVVSVMSNLAPTAAVPGVEGGELPVARRVVDTGARAIRARCPITRFPARLVSQGMQHQRQAGGLLAQRMALPFRRAFTGILRVRSTRPLPMG
jgi:hypothetical protein